MNRSLLKRTIRNIKRSGWRAYAMIFMMTITYIMLGSLLSVLYSTQKLAVYFEQKPEVIGFFNEEVTEEQILEVKRELESRDYVSEVKYVSKEQAMNSFVEENSDNQEILESITVNVFPAHLNVKSTSLDKVPEVANFFRENELISDVLDSENVLDTLTKVVLGIQIFGFSLLAIFATSTVFIIFLAVGITVYSHKEEIRIMKLVGATDNYVRMPYLMQSLFYSLISVVISTLILLPVLLTQYQSVMSALLGDLNIIDIDITIISIVILSTVIFASVLSLFSSYFATRRYIND